MPRSPIAAVLAALAATWLFFFEYLPPVRSVHIPYDLAGYHYPLADYIFQSLKQGRFPQWDPSMYSGMDFVSNVQAALFYPPTWLMFAWSWRFDLLPYLSLQILTLLHVPLAFLLCYLWLRAKPLDGMAAAMGAAVFAYSGYLCLQLQHFGLVAGYAWFPLGLWGIDEARAQGRWRPLWKLAAASALCFLAGYPPTWVVYAACAGVYALAGSRRRWVVPGAVAALLLSLAISAVQVLPAWEATQFREPEENFGSGHPELEFYASYLVPNYFDFGPDVALDRNPLKEYLYLGAPGIAGLGLLAVALARRRRALAPALPALAMGAMSLLVAANPFGLVWEAIRHSDLLADVVRSTYFLAGITLAASELSARGLDAFLAAEGRPVPHRWVRASIYAMGAWAIIEIIRWPERFPDAGWAVIDPMITLAIFGVALYAYRSQRGELRLWLAVALLVFAGVDYKAFGTDKRFNAGSGTGPEFYADHYKGMNQEAYETLRGAPDYRILIDEFGPLPGELRHALFTTPQGFEPFLSQQYRELIGRTGTWRTNRLFDLDPDNEAVLRLYGVGYVATSDASPIYAWMIGDSRFRLVGSEDYYYKVFEYRGAKPAYGWDSGAEDATAELLAWEPERRAFRVRSGGRGRFTLSTQFYPGWSATVDGAPAAIERWEGAFQAIDVEGGEHTVEFRYRSRYLLPGAGVSLISLAGLLWFVRRTGSSPTRGNSSLA